MTTHCSNFQHISHPQTVQLQTQYIYNLWITAHYTILISAVLALTTGLRAPTPVDHTGLTGGDSREPPCCLPAGIQKSRQRLCREEAAHCGPGECVGVWVGV